jgi:hypothetical protein
MGKFLKEKYAFCVVLFRLYTFKPQRLLYVPPSVTFKYSTCCPFSAYVSLLIPEQTDFIFPLKSNWLFSVIEMECIYCVVRCESIIHTHVSLHIVFTRRRTERRLRNIQRGGLTGIGEALHIHSLTLLFLQRINKRILK